jgi:C4-dicarboxylate-specific signal transduction histidine kinase
MQASEALHEAQPELAHANRLTAIGQLASSIAHEINQPLTAMITNADVGLRWLGRQPPDAEEHERALGMSSRTASAPATSSARSVPSVRRSRHGKMTSRSTSYPGSHFLDPWRADEERCFGADATRGGLALIREDRVQLQQVILNLILNAVQAMSGVTERTRELLISTQQEASGAVLVTVQDSGPGFSPESFDRLFDPFYTTKVEGMGIWLSICR